MTTLQQQARALGDPTRHQVFRYVADAAAPVDVAELTAHFGLNHNAIRQHLAKLVEAGLVVEETAASGGRGRPRLVYVLDPATESRWGVTGPYERLSLWLAEMVRTGDTPVEVGRRAGRRQRLGGTEIDDPVSNLVDQMARHGFDPTVRQRDTAVDITLRTCPFESTALADPDTVCELHLGMAYGIAEGIDGLEVDELVPKDPRRAHCRLRCHLEPVA
ncbi:MAG: MarR family transcriptional regulator [Acidimicrobiales bacterium]